MRLENIEIGKLPSSRSEASKFRSQFYYTGKPCKRGHIVPRYTSTGQCVSCQEVHYRKKTTHNPRPSKRDYLERARRIAIERGGHCLSTEYVNAKKLLAIACGISDHPPFKISYDNLNQGKWCPVCKFDRVRGNFKYNIDDMKRFAKDQGGECLSTKFLGIKKKLKWSCRNPNHRDFLATPDNVIQGKWCPQCGEEKKGREIRPIDDVLQIIKKRGGELISLVGEYRGYETRAKIKCANGHTWSPKVHSIFIGHWCPKCIESVGETITRKIFEATYGVPFPKKRPSFLLSKKGGRLELDGYNADKKLAFEYQGPHHSRPDQIKRDDTKRQLCFNRGITIVEIPYVKNPYPPENVLKKVKKEIQKIDPSRTVILADEDFFLKELYELREIARSRGGNLLSNIYLGSKEKMLWSCGNPNHPPWKTIPQNIRRGHWCRYCSQEAILQEKALLNMKRLKAFGSSVGLTLISKEYKGSRELYEWRCKYGHVVKRTKPFIIKSIKRGRNACTICEKTSIPRS